jgi:hypothetical protein
MKSMILVNPEAAEEAPEMLNSRSVGLGLQTLAIPARSQDFRTFRAQNPFPSTKTRCS